MIHRSVFESIRAKYPHLRPKTLNKPWHYFTPMADEVVRQMEGLVNGAQESVTVTKSEVARWLEASRIVAHAGEDVAFCLRAGKAGHASYVDLDVVCGHLGAACWGPSNTHV